MIYEVTRGVVCTDEGDNLSLVTTRRGGTVRGGGEIIHTRCGQQMGFTEIIQIGITSSHIRQ